MRSMKYHIPFAFFLAIFISLLIPLSADAAVLQVGPGKTYTKPSQAYSAAMDGDTIEIAAGLYLNDPICITKNNLTFRGVGGKAHFKVEGSPRPPLAKGSGCTGKGIFVTKGNNTTIENLEFSGARNSDRNGAGIRHQGINLIVRGSYFHDNEMGILTANKSEDSVTIMNSEFAYNYDRSKSKNPHNVYIGRNKSFTFINNYTHHASIGHTLKTRSALNYIIGNRIMDETDGNASYQIDINGGKAYVIGNVVQKGRKAENNTLLNFMVAPKSALPPYEVFVINNTFVSEHVGKGTYVEVSNKTPGDVNVTLMNNLFVGPATYTEVKAPHSTQVANLTLPLSTTELVNIPAYDYRWAANGSGINAGVNPGSASGYSLVPTIEYVHPASGKTRTISGPAIDVGAHEFYGTPTRLYPLPIVHFTSSLSNVDTSSDITWTSNADTCTASGAWSGTKPASGTFNTGLITQSTDYTITCTGKGGSVLQTITVTPPDAAGITFKAELPVVPSGSGTLLTWAATNAKSCIASGAWSGSVGTASAYETGPLTTEKTYTLTCIGLADEVATKSITVSVAGAIERPTLQPTFRFSADASEIASTEINAPIIPLIGPPGIVAKKGKGIVALTATPSGKGVYFGPGDAKAKNSGYLNFPLSPEVGSALFSENGGEVTVVLVSKYDPRGRGLAIESASGGHKHQKFLSMWSGTNSPSGNGDMYFALDAWQGRYIFSVNVPGGVPMKYALPEEAREVLFKEGATLTLRIAWNGSTEYFYINDALVVAQSYSKKPITWAPSARMLIGAGISERYGSGFHKSVDIVDSVNIGRVDPVPQPTGLAVPTPVPVKVTDTKPTTSVNPNTTATSGTNSGTAGTGTASRQVEVRSTHVEPIHRWSFDGTPNDSAGTRHADIRGGAGSSLYTNGKLGQALRLNGNDMYVKFPSAGLEGSPSSISFWFNGSTLAGKTLFSGSSNGTCNNRPRLSFTSTSQLRASMNVSGGPCGNLLVAESPNALSENAWHHVVITTEAHALTLYVNGSRAGSAATTTASSFGLARGCAFIGILERGDCEPRSSSITSDRLFAGAIDEVRMYDRAISAAEVQMLYANGVTITTPSSSRTASVWDAIAGTLGRGTPAASVTPTGVPGVVLTRTLAFGMRGADVIDLQNYLIKNSYLASDGNTGYFGPLTKAAVARFQCERMNVCSEEDGAGTVGPKTRAALQH